MIFDIIQRSLSSPNVLVSVEELLANSQGSRMPDVHAIELNATIARRAVDSCGISALAINEVEGRTILSLDYGKCTGCGHCIEVGEGAFVQAKSVPCGVSRQALVRRWDVERGDEILRSEEHTSELQSLRHLVCR